MIKLTKEKALYLHQMMADATGGSVGIRDHGLLESALESAFSSFAGTEFYPTIEEKAARLGFSLISNHAFVDGNKRIGMYIMLIFLEINGAAMDCSCEDVVHAGLSVAAGTMDYSGLLQWLRSHRC